MQQSARVVISSARMQIGVYDLNKLHDEVMLKLLHNIILDYDNLRINKKESDDRFLHEISCGIEYDEVNRDYIVYFGEGSDDEIRDFVPEYLHYTNPDATYNHMPNRIYLSTLGDYQIDSYEKFSKVGVFHGNSFEKYRLGMRLKLNMSPELVAKYSWRLTFKKAFAQIIGYEDAVPFPPEHSNLLETALAFRSLDVVDDVSPAWDKKFARLKLTLGNTLKMQEELYMSWLESEPEARSKNLIGYDYRLNQRNRLRGRYVPILRGDD